MFDMPISVSGRESSALIENRKKVTKICFGEKWRCPKEVTCSKTSTISSRSLYMTLAGQVWVWRW